MWTRSLLVLLAFCGCAADHCDTERHAMTLDLVGAQGAAVVISGQTDARREFLHAEYRARIANRGPEPCRVAFHQRADLPMPGEPATEPPDFVTVVPGAQGGNVFVRFVDGSSEHELSDTALLPRQGIFILSDPEAEGVDAVLQIETCTDADLQIDLQIDTEVCSTVRRLHGSFDVERLW